MTFSPDLKKWKIPTGPIDVTDLVIEDDSYVDNIYCGQLQRKLVQILNDAQPFPQPFFAETNIGIFYEPKEDPLVPDMFLSLGVQRAEDLTQKKNLSYFVWEMGKVPEICVEVVSNNEGDEIDLSRRSIKKGKTRSKKDRYAQIGVKYYIVCDPLKKLQKQMKFAKVKMWKLSPDGDYPEELSQSIFQMGDIIWLDEIGVGLTLWAGEYEQMYSRQWYRWCDRDGNLYLTGKEQAALATQKTELESQRAEQEKARAEQEKARAEQEKARAEQEKARAENAESRAEQSDRRAENAEANAQRLADRLRALGIDPNSL